MSIRRISTKGLKFHAPLTDKYLQTSVLASDVSAYHNHSNFVAGSPSFSSAGVEFGGSADYIRFPAAGIFGGVNTTVLMRFTPDFDTNDNTQRNFFDTEAGASRYFVTKAANAFNNILRIQFGNTIIQDIAEATYSPFWFINQENTLIITATSGDTNAWLNGNQILTNDTTAWSPSVNSILLLGTNQTPTPTFDGHIKDFMVFDRILNEEERNAFDNSTHGVSATSKIDSLQKGLVFDMPLTDKWLNENGFSQDRTPNRKNMTNSVGSPSYSSDGVSFPTNDSDYLYRDELAFRGGDSFGSVSIWFRTTDSVNNNKHMFVIGDTSSQDYYITFLVSSFTFRVTLRNNPSPVSGAMAAGDPLNDGKWHHGVVTSNGSRYLIYVDGQQREDIGSNVNDGKWFADIVSSDSISIGIWRTSSVDLGFKGDMYGIKVWNRELSATEILNLYHQDRPENKIVSPLNKGLVLDIPLTSEWERPGGVSDKTPYRNHTDTTYGSPVVTATETTFNGTTDYFYRSVDSFRNSDSVGTISAWVKFTSIAELMSILCSSDEASGNSFDMLISYGRLRWTIPGLIGGWFGPDTIRDGTWHQVAVVREGIYIYYYYDGIKVLTNSPAAWFSSKPTRNNIVIGAKINVNGLSATFNGSIKNIKIWNRTLSDEEMMQLYKEGE